MTGNARRSNCDSVPPSSARTRIVTPYRLWWRVMHEFLTANRAELIARCRAKVAQRSLPGTSERELENGITIFLDQLIKTLVMEQTATPMLSRKVSGPSGGGKPELSEMSDSATRHGKELQRKWSTTTATCASRSPTSRSKPAHRSKPMNSAPSTAAWTMRSPARSPNSVTSATS